MKLVSAIKIINPKGQLKAPLTLGISNFEQNCITNVQDFLWWSHILIICMHFMHVDPLMVLMCEYSTVQYTLLYNLYCPVMCDCLIHGEIFRM